MRLLDRYVLRSIFSSVALVMSVLMVLASLFVFLDQQSDIGKGNYDTVQAFWYVALNLPHPPRRLPSVFNWRGSPPSSIRPTMSLRTRASTRTKV